MSDTDNERQVIFTRGYHASILLSNGDFVVETFSSAHDLARRLKELIDQDVSVHCFSGDRLQISKPPLRHLMTPDGTFALYDTPTTLEPDDTGYLGVDPAYFEGPPQVQLPTQEAPKLDEFFSDDTNEIRNIFDDALPDPDS